MAGRKQWHRRCAAATGAFAISSFVGCTHWSSTQYYGEAVEVSRRPIGSPRAVDRTETTAQSGELRMYRPAGPMGIEASTGSRHVETHRERYCAQKVEITMQRPVNTVYEARGRPIDILASVLLIGIGATSLAIDSAETRNYQKTKAFHDQNFSSPFFAGTEPQPPGNGFAVAGVAFLTAGAIWGATSLLFLPAGTRPERAVAKDQFSVFRNVESTGCSPESHAAPETSRSPAAKKLEELKSLRDQGLLTEEEYERKRRAAVEGL